jgi:hypothetical protein
VRRLRGLRGLRELNLSTIMRKCLLDERILSYPINTGPCERGE